MTRPTLAAEAALAQVNASVAVASGLAATGRAIDLQGLEAAAGTLCAQVLDLSPADAVGFRTPLILLQHKIAQLASTMERARSCPPVP